MACSKCSYLERALESRHREYHTACSRALRRISLKFAAYDFVELERARSELDMHRSVCLAAIASAPGLSYAAAEPPGIPTSRLTTDSSTLVAEG